MTTKAKTTNGQATAEDVAQSAPQKWQVPDAVARRIIDKAKAVDEAIAARDELIELARDLLEVGDGAQLRPVPGGGLVFVDA